MNIEAELNQHALSRNPPTTALQPAALQSTVEPRITVAANPRAHHHSIVFAQVETPKGGAMTQLQRHVNNRFISRVFCALAIEFVDGRTRRTRGESMYCRWRVGLAKRESAASDVSSIMTDDAGHLLRRLREKQQRVDAQPASSPLAFADVTRREGRGRYSGPTDTQQQQRRPR